MKKRLVKVNPQIIDLKYPEIDNQDTIISCDDDSCLKLDRNESTRPPSRKALDSLQRSIEHDSLNHYADSDVRKLRRRLSHYTGVSFNAIACFGNEASALEAISRTYLQHGLDGLVTWPNEGLISHYMSSTGARVINAHFEDPFKPRIEELIDGISQKTRMIYISNPNPITGALLSEPELVFLLSYASNIMVVVDESYYEYSDCTLANMIDSYPNLIVIRSFSHAFALAGLDISYILTDPDNLRFINRLAVGKYPDMLAQNAAIAALDDTAYLSMSLSEINESKKILYNHLNGLGYEFYISPANFITLKVPKPSEFIGVLADHKIYVKHLAQYDGFENHIRIAIGSPEKTRMLLNVLDKLESSGEHESERIHNRLTQDITLTPK